MKDLFEYLNYRIFLNEWIAARPNRGRGMIANLAKEAHCQAPYLSRVLMGKAQLSLEQAHALQGPLELSREELTFFLLLIEWDRAGNSALKGYFREQIETARIARLDLKKRFTDAHTLSEEDQRTYYSSSHFAAVHTCISVPRLQTLQQLQAFLRLSQKRLREVLDHLVRSGLAVREGERWKVGKTRLHLDRGSDLIRQHQINWRIEALKSLERDQGAQNEEELHYAAVVSLSEEDAIRLTELWIKTLEQFNREIAPSKEETVRALVIDFFSVGERSS